ncbi:hypothetical protein [Sinanaerobacter chloroacetimidivorans]|jgi:hypothetical protein|nr:hypothetical protein [Sinanaerobacter chloroacetimidivorans]
MDNIRNNSENTNNQKLGSAQKNDTEVIQGNYIKLKVYPGIYTN